MSPLCRLAPGAARLGSAPRTPVRALPECRSPVAMCRTFCVCAPDRSAEHRHSPSPSTRLSIQLANAQAYVVIGKCVCICVCVSVYASTSVYLYLCNIGNCNARIASELGVGACRSIVHTCSESACFCVRKMRLGYWALSIAANITLPPPPSPTTNATNHPCCASGPSGTQ